MTAEITMDEYEQRQAVFKMAKQAGVSYGDLTNDSVLPLLISYLNELFNGYAIEIVDSYNSCGQTRFKLNLSEIYNCNTTVSDRSNIGCEGRVDIKKLGL